MARVPRLIHSFRNSTGLHAALSAAVLALTSAAAPAQTQLWIRQFGTSANESAGAAPDGTGGAFVFGGTDGSLAGPNAGGTDAWVGRYDSAGNQLWVRQLGTNIQDWFGGAALDGAGGVFLCGQSQIDWEVGDMILLVRYDGAGNHLWTRQLGTSAPDAFRDVESDGAGGFYVLGSTQGDLAGPNAGGWDAWIARYDGGGNQLWVRQFGTSSADRASAGAPDGAGGIFAAGATWGSLAGPNAGFADGWLARYDSGGNLVWIRQFGTSFVSDYISYAAADSSGGIYAIGNGNLIAAAWIGRYDSGGNQLWRVPFGTSGIHYIHAAVPDSAGGLLLCGGLWSPGDYDAWFARLDSTGQASAIERLGTPSFDLAYGMAADGVGGIYVSGGTAGALGGPSAGRFDAFLARYDGSTGTCTPLVYCTPKASSSGCVPSIGSSGSPSIAAGSFAVAGASIEGAQLGVVIHTTNGQASIPFQGGTLCLAPPMLRLGVQGSGGTLGACDGGYVQPAAANVLATAGAGSTVWFQIWFRDPSAASGTGLSDALEVLVCP